MAFTEAAREEWHRVRDTMMPKDVDEYNSMLDAIRADANHTPVPCIIPTFHAADWPILAAATAEEEELDVDEAKAHAQAARPIDIVASSAEFF